MNNGMRLYQLLIVARYESKVVRRDFLFWVLVFLVIGVISYYHAVNQGNFGGPVSWSLVSMPSAIPLVNTYLFNIFQSFILVFVCTNLYRRERCIDSLQAIHIRPISNMNYTLGKALGIFLVFIQLNILSLGIAFLVNLFASRAPLSLWLYFYYFFMFSLPSLCFMLGFSLFVIRGVRQAILALLIVLCCFLGGLLFLPFVCYGVFDVLGISLPNFFSQAVGCPVFGNFFIQRLSVIILGIAFLWLSVIFSNRLFNRVRGKRNVFYISLVLLAMGEFLSWNYYNTFREVESLRSSYRLVFQKYDVLGGHAHVDRHEICYDQQGSDLYLFSDLILTNPHEQTLDSVVIFLNPGLEIKSIMENNQEIPYVRSNQAIVLKKKLYPSDTLRLLMKYEGRVDEHICYIDKPLPVSTNYGDTPFRFGVRYAYVEKDYTLLLPEILWYPMTVPPTNVSAPELPRLDFTSFVLRLPRKYQQSVVTQGIESYEKDQIIYRSAEKYPGLTLCIGDYEKKYLWMGNYAVELYYFRKHDFFESFSLLNKKDIEEVINDILFQENFPQYPYERLCFVETPISFFTPVREWKGTSDLIQPGIVFLPEQGTTLSRASMSVDIYNKNDLEGEERKISKQQQRLRNLIFGTLLSPTLTPYQGSSPIEWLFTFNGKTARVNDVTSLYIKPLFLDYSNFLYSAEMPAVDKALRVMESEKNHVYRGGRIHPFQNNLPFLTYFAKKNLEEALQDTTLSVSFRDKLINLKALDLYAYLRGQIPGNGLDVFLADFQKKHRYKWTTLEQFNSAIENYFDLDIRPFLKQWYRDTCFPCFSVRDVSFWRVEQKDGFYTWKVHFKIRNSGKVGGTIAVLLPGSGIFEPYLERYYWIPAGACKEIKLAIDNKFSILTISTGISSNLPDFFEYCLPVQKAFPVTSDQEIGSFDCSLDVFEKDPDEFVVDNEDPGFRLVEDNTRETLATLRNKKEKYKSYMTELPSRWQFMLSPYFYGDKIKSACVKLVGVGNAKAEWNAELQKDGVYEVFTRYADFGWNASTMVSGAKLYYAVVQDDKEFEVVLELDDSVFRFQEQKSGSWLSLGEFNFKAGQVKVVVDDRGGKIENAQQLIFADAIKFVRKK